MKETNKNNCTLELPSAYIFFKTLIRKGTGSSGVSLMIFAIRSWKKFNNLLSVSFRSSWNTVQQHPCTGPNLTTVLVWFKWRCDCRSGNCNLSNILQITVFPRTNNSRCSINRLPRIISPPTPIGYAQRIPIVLNLEDEAKVERFKLWCWGHWHWKLIKETNWEHLKCQCSVYFMWLLFLFYGKIEQNI